MARHVSVELLADHPQHVEALARWHCEEDGRAGDDAWLAFWCRQLRAECGRQRLPIALVAVDGQTPVGHVSLVEQNMSSHPELSPWLAGTLVHPARRGEGIGTALAQQAVSRATQLGVAALYLYTERARGFYERLGWRHLWDERYERQTVAVLAIKLDRPLILRHTSTTDARGARP